MNLKNFNNLAVAYGIFIMIMGIIGTVMGLPLAWLVIGISLVVIFLGVVIGIIRNKQDVLGRRGVENE